MFIRAMKHVILPMFVLASILLGMAAWDQAAARAAIVSGDEPPLRLSEPVDAVIADLESTIPEYMREENIPGVSIALIREGQIVWTEGFGVANAITRQPVTPETVFEMASNSKVATAYIALRLVDQGKLSLDAPLNAYLPEPWLPPSEYRDTITLRHVLSHSSGLGKIGRESLFAPGRGYYYSPSGFHYLQAVIEQVTGQSLEDIAQEMVFVPLGMSSSSFVNPTEIKPRMANGHWRAFIPALLFVVPYVVSLVLVGVLGLLILRIRTGQWRPAWRTVIRVSAVAYVLSLLPAVILLGNIDMLEFVWLIALCGLALTLAFASLFLAGRAIIGRLSRERPRQQIVLTVAWSVLIVLVLCYLTSKGTNLPVPKWSTVRADAAGSMQATASDMAAFLIEFSDPQYLSAEMAAQLRTSQMRLSSDLSWGLGSGIQHSQQGDALWQWGQHLDFQSVMIIYPQHGWGIVVCANNDMLNPNVAVEIAHRALGGKIEPIHQAVNLEFNYRGP